MDMDINSQNELLELKFSRLSFYTVFINMLLKGGFISEMLHCTAKTHTHTQMTQRRGTRYNSPARTHLWVKLLLCPGVTILAAVSTVTLGGLAPLVPVLHVGAGSGPVGDSVTVSNSNGTVCTFYYTMYIPPPPHLYLYLRGFLLRSLLLW